MCWSSGRNLTPQMASSFSMKCFMGRLETQRCVCVCVSMCLFLNLVFFPFCICQSSRRYIQIHLFIAAPCYYSYWDRKFTIAQTLSCNNGDIQNVFVIVSDLSRWSFSSVSAGSHSLCITACLPKNRWNKTVACATRKLQPEGPRDLPGRKRLLHKDHPLLHAQS